MQTVRGDQPKKIMTYRWLVVCPEGVVLSSDACKPVHKLFEVVGHVHIGVEWERMDDCEELGVLNGFWGFGALDHRSSDGKKEDVGG